MDTRHVSLNHPASPTTWPTFLEPLIVTPRHRARLYERAEAIGDPKIVAVRLEQVNRERPILTHKDLKDALDRMEIEGLSEPARRHDTRRKGNVVYLPGTESSPKNLEALADSRDAVEIEKRVSFVIASADAALRKEINDKKLPKGKDANMALLRSLLGIRRSAGGKA